MMLVLATGVLTTQYVAVFALAGALLSVSRLLWRLARGRGPCAWQL
jgi:hypothetical protein